MKDELGNNYDIFGNVVSGPNARTNLKALGQFMGFWFSWGAFYEGLRLVELK